MHLRRKILGPQPSNPAWAGLGLLAVALFGIYKYATVLDRFYPIEHWLFWQLAKLWGWVGLLSVACTSFGQLLLSRVLKPRGLQPLESAVFAMATGLVCFNVALYIGGALAWFNAYFAVLLPLGMFALGARHGLRLLLSLLHSAQYARRTPLSFLMVCAGSVCVFVLYLGALTPDALNYDSTWCHLTVSQDYARAGRIVPFPADYTKNMPQLASMIHTWGYLVPGLDTPLRWMLVLHNELGLVLWTLAGVAAGIRRLVQDQRITGSWATFFLFPIIFVYDNNLGGAADHVCAFFSVPLLLATLRFCRGFALADAALLGMMGAGGLATKYQAAYLLVGVTLVVGSLWLQELWRLRHASSRSTRRRVLLAPLVAAGTLILFVSPHFIRQTVFHHNPVYPFLQNVIPSTPTQPNAALLFNNTISDPHWIPSGSVATRLRHAARLFWSFSFEPHYSFTKNFPVFGSLFTLLLPALLFIRERFRILIAAVISGVALFIWAFVYNVDRNLQVFMPVMVCATGALIVRIWRQAPLARLGLAPLVALQIVWGGDALFYSSYTRVDSAITLIRSGFEGNALTRFDSYRRSFRDIQQALPPTARVLLHNAHPSLGIDRDIYLDGVGFQGLVSYDNTHTPAELYRYFRKLGITHLLYDPQGFRAPTKQQEVLWNALLKEAREIGTYANYKLLELPEQAPPDQPPWRVALMGIGGYADGIYPVQALNTDEKLPPSLQHYAQPQKPLPQDPKQLVKELEQVQAALISRSTKLGAPVSELLHRQFERNLIVQPFTLYLRK